MKLAIICLVFVAILTTLVDSHHLRRPIGGFLPYEYYGGIGRPSWNSIGHRRPFRGTWRTFSDSESTEVTAPQNGTSIGTQSMNNSSDGGQGQVSDRFWNFNRPSGPSAPTQLFNHYWAEFQQQRKQPCPCRRSSSSSESREGHGHKKPCKKPRRRTTMKRSTTGVPLTSHATSTMSTSTSNNSSTMADASSTTEVSFTTEGLTS